MYVVHQQYIPNTLTNQEGLSQLVSEVSPNTLTFLSFSTFSLGCSGVSALGSLALPLLKWLSTPFAF